MTGSIRSWYILAMAAFAMNIVACADDGSSTDSCDDATCTTPPANFCDGDQLVTYAASGTCVDDGCTYEATTTTCDDVCADAACVGATDPCDGVACDDPPASSCDGDVAVTWDDPGACTDGECAYEEVRTDCEDVDRVCEDGQCVDPIGDPCDGLACDEPPGAFCDDGDAVSYEEEGTCDDGECTYTETRETCEGTTECDGGRCVEVDACDGITCDEPPTASCNDDGQAVTWAPEGTCTEGECAYTETVTDCDEGDVCAEGACVDAVDPCADLVCDTPPEATCDGDTARTWDAAGTCVVGDDGAAGCEYTPTDTACGEGLCLEGACLATPASGDLTVTEIFYDYPGSDDFKEWFEVHNLADAPLLLTGIAVTDDDGDRFEIGEGVIIAPGEFLVFAEADDATPVVDVVWDTDFTLGNTRDELVLSLDDTELLRVAYDEDAEFEPWPEAADASLSLDPLFYVAPETPNGWCFGVDVYDDTGERPALGSPGEANPDCDLECFDVDCSMPMPTCDGDERITYTGDGVCNLGICNFDDVAERENCADTDGFTCVAGECVVAAPDLAEGDLVITEIMANLDGDDDGLEWFEIYNTTDMEITLAGLEIREAADDGEAFVVEAGSVGAGEYFVFVQTATAIESGEVSTYDWGGVDVFRLGNTADEIVILAGDVEVDRVEYDEEADPAWPNTNATSLTFGGDPTVDDNNDPTEWCEAETLYDGTNAGTPGADNDSCLGDAVAPGEGDLVITEFMANPAFLADSAGEYFEVYNPTDLPIDLSGLTISDDGSDTFSFDAADLNGDATAVLEPGGYFVFAKSAEAAGGRVDYVYGSDMTLANGDDEIVLSVGDTTVDRVAYDDGGDPPWTITSGVSLQVSSFFLNASSNDGVAAWCNSTAIHAGDDTDLGTPGGPNRLCGF